MTYLTSAYSFLEIIGAPPPANCGWCAACSGSGGPAVGSPVTRMDGRSGPGETCSKMLELYRIISNCVHVLHPRELQIPRGLFGIEAASSRDLVRVTSVSSVPKNLDRRRCQFIHDLTLRKRSKSLFLMPVDIFQVVVSSWNHWASGLRLNCLSKVRSCNRQDLGIAALQHRYFVTPSCHHILHLEPGQLCCASCAAAWIPTLLVNELQVW